MNMYSSTYYTGRKLYERIYDRNLRSETDLELNEVYKSRLQVSKQRYYNRSFYDLLKVQVKVCLIKNDTFVCFVCLFVCLLFSSNCDALSITYIISVRFVYKVYVYITC